jgi:hypothetical protein
MEGPEPTGLAHDIERERAREATVQCLAARARETERERERAGEETGADRSAPLGRERERESACGREGCC